MRLHPQMIHVLFLASLCFSGVGCSLGTEVGNGFKPGKDGGGDSSTQMPKKASSNDAADDAATDDLFESYDSMGGGVSAGMGSISSTGAISSKAKTDAKSGIPESSESRVGGREFRAIDSAMLSKDQLATLLVDLAMTGCASPLYGSGTPSGHTELSLTGFGAVRYGNITVTASSDGKSWDITGPDPALKRTVTLTPTVTVKAPGANGVVVDVPSYSMCEVQSVTSTTSLNGYSGTFRATTQKLTTSRGYTYLTWYVQDGSGDYITRLKRIELNKSPDAQQPSAVYSVP